MKKPHKKKPAPHKGKVAEKVVVWLPEDWKLILPHHGRLIVFSGAPYADGYIPAELHIPKPRSRR